MKQHPGGPVLYDAVGTGQTALSNRCKLCSHRATDWLSCLSYGFHHHRLVNMWQKHNRGANQFSWNKIERGDWQARMKGTAWKPLQLSKGTYKTQYLKHNIGMMTKITELDSKDNWVAHNVTRFCMLATDAQKVVCKVNSQQYFKMAFQIKLLEPCFLSRLETPNHSIHVTVHTMIREVAISNVTQSPEKVLKILSVLGSCHIPTRRSAGNWQSQTVQDAANSSSNCQWFRNTTIFFKHWNQCCSILTGFYHSCLTVHTGMNFLY